MSRFLKGLTMMHKRGFGFRMYSSSVKTGPFLRLGRLFKEKGEEDIIFFDAAKEELLIVPNKPHPEELTDTNLIGYVN